MTILFRAKTEEAYTIKTLAELLQHTIRTACLEITEEGIHLRMMDTHRYMLVDIVLESANFKVYECNVETMYLGINLTHLFRMLKSIKKKDTVLIMSVDSDEPGELRLEVCPKDRSLVTVSSVHVQRVQNVDIPLPIGYGSPVNIVSAEYQRNMKDLCGINDTVDITMYTYAVKFRSASETLFSREIIFGETDDLDCQNQLFHDTFSSDQLIRIQKVAGLGRVIKVYGSDQLPLCIQTDVGGLGTIAIYIKSYDQSINS